METRESIKSQFDELGFDLDDAALDKCKYLGYNKIELYIVFNQTIW